MGAAMKKLLLSLVAGMIALFPSAAMADHWVREDSETVSRIRGDVFIAEGEAVGSLLIIDGNAYIGGTVQGTVFILRGDAEVTGAVTGHMTVVAGDIDLRDKARVASVTSIGGDLSIEDGAVLQGKASTGLMAFFRWVSSSSFFMIWAGVTLLLLVAGMFFAAVGGRQLLDAAESLTVEPGSTMVGALTLWVGIPALAVLSMLVLIGHILPTLAAILLLAFAAAWVLGYIATATKVGGILVRRRDLDPNAVHPYDSTVFGLVLLQSTVLVPVLGPVVFIAAGVWGAGSLALHAYRAAGGRPLSMPPLTLVHGAWGTRPSIHLPLIRLRHAHLTVGPPRMTRDSAGTGVMSGVTPHALDEDT
jgi:hypothetical protein